MEEILSLRGFELRRHVQSVFSLKKLPVLKKACRERRLRVGGRKEKLVERLVDDVLMRGWSVPSESDLWMDASLADPFANRSPPKLPPAEYNPSISNSDDSESGRSSSSPSSSAASRRTVGALRSGRPSPSRSSCSSSGGAGSESGGDSDSSARKRIRLSVDTEAPKEKRRKSGSVKSGPSSLDTSLDSGISAASFSVRSRPRMPRRALKASLRSARSSCSLLSENNADLIRSTMEDFGGDAATPSVDAAPFTATTFRTFLAPFVREETTTEEPDCVCIDAAESASHGSKVVATVTSAGVPVAIVTSDDSGSSLLSLATSKTSTIVTPSVDWIEMRR